MRSCAASSVASLWTGGSQANASVAHRHHRLPRQPYVQYMVGPCAGHVAAAVVAVVMAELSPDPYQGLEKQ